MMTQVFPTVTVEIAVGLNHPIVAYALTSAASVPFFANRVVVAYRQTRIVLKKMDLVLI
jgi:hypothetical protein